MFAAWYGVEHSCIIRHVDTQHHLREILQLVAAQVAALRRQVSQYKNSVDIWEHTISTGMGLILDVTS